MPDTRSIPEIRKTKEVHSGEFTPTALVKAWVRGHRMHTEGRGEPLVRHTLSAGLHRFKTKPRRLSKEQTRRGWAAATSQAHSPLNLDLAFHSSKANFINNHRHEGNPPGHSLELYPHWLTLQMPYFLLTSTSFGEARSTRESASRASALLVLRLFFPQRKWLTTGNRTRA